MTNKRQALRELLQRYSQAFQHAWQHRKAMEPTARLPHEAQFLPAALSLQETPVSPAPRVAMWLLIAFALLATLWACFGRIDVVATAPGKIVPNDRIKTIQPFETATIKAIHVSDGQTVKAGDILIELDGTVAFADTERVQNDLNSARLQVARGQALLQSLQTGKPAALIRPQQVSDAQYLEAQQLLHGQVAEYHAKLSRLDAEDARRQATLVSTKEQINKLEQTVPIAQRRAQDYKELAEQNYASKHQQLEHEQTRIEQEAELASLRAKLIETQASLAESRSQRRELTAETRRIAMDSINEGQQKTSSLEQERLKAGSRGELMRLTAPVDGTVQQLAIHTIGGVVTPAQALMVIVPKEQSVEIEAFIENKDIGFVKPGQDAEVKIETFQYTKYGTLHAKVHTVSHDAIQQENKEEHRGLIYATRVQLEKSTLNIDGTNVHLSPGMAVTVEIKTGTRRVIEYFLSPLMQHVDESLRER